MKNDSINFSVRRKYLKIQLPIMSHEESHPNVNILLSISICRIDADIIFFCTVLNLNETIAYGKFPCRTTSTVTFKE